MTNPALTKLAALDPRRVLTLARLARASWRVARDPNRLDEVIGIADALSDTAAFEEIVAYVKAMPAGPANLADRPRVDLDLPRLRALPDGTFGREAARFLDARGLDPADLPHRPSPDGPSWVRAHLFESHDLWHVVTGFDTDVPGEAGLQAFYLAQFPARLATILLGIVMLNTFLWRFDERDARMDAIAQGWQLGKQAQPLFGVRWAELWHVPLADVRVQLGLPAAGIAAPAAARTAAARAAA